MGSRGFSRINRPGKTHCAGQALIEFALVLPILLWLIINVVNFGGLLYAWITVANAARTGAQYMVMSDTWVFGLSPPTAAQVANMVAQDLSSLHNRTSLQVKVCINVAGTTTCSPSGGTAPGDPEPLSFTSSSVDVTYTYQPFIKGFDFSRLKISTSLMWGANQTIHRRVVMRCVGGCVAS